MTLVADGVRSVRNFIFDKAAASVLTSCVSIENILSSICMVAWVANTINVSSFNNVCVFQISGSRPAPHVNSVCLKRCSLPCHKGFPPS